MEGRLLDRLRPKISLMADVLTKEGSIDYAPNMASGRRMHVRFCGMTGIFMDSQLKTLLCHNMEVCIENDDVIFKSGDMPTFEIWYARLATFGPSRIARYTEKQEELQLA